MKHSKKTCSKTEKMPGTLPFNLKTHPNYTTNSNESIAEQNVTPEAGRLNLQHLHRQPMMDRAVTKLFKVGPTFYERGGHVSIPVGSAHVATLQVRKTW